MMDGFAGLITTIIGATIGAVLNEMYKRHRDAVAASAAIAGELASYAGTFGTLDSSLSVLLARAQRGESLNIPQQAPAKDTAYDAYVDKIGLLGPGLAEEIALVYGQIRAFRSALFPIAGPEQPVDPAYGEAALKVAHMFAQRASQGGEKLIPALRIRSRQSFLEHLLPKTFGAWRRWRK